MYPDFNRLKVFYYIYKYGGVAQAAQMLHITQPAVSQQIAKLESELGTLLFMRVNRRLVPTSDGESLFNTIKPFIHDLDAQLKSFSQANTSPTGTLRIGMPYEFGKKYLPPVCAQFYQKYPDVRYNLRFGESAALLRMLQTGAIDLAGIDTLIGEGILEWEKHRYVLVPVFQEDIILVCSSRYYREVMGGDDSLENLLRQPFVTDEADGVSVINWFRTHYNIKANISNWLLMSKSHSVIVDCLKLGMGLGITSSHFITDEIKRGEVHVFEPDNNPITNYVSLAYLADKDLTPAEKLFISSFETIVPNLS